MMQLNLLQVDINPEQLTENEMKNLRGKTQDGAGKLWLGTKCISTHWPLNELPTPNYLNIIVELPSGKHHVDWFRGILLIMSSCNPPFYHYSSSIHSPI